MHCRLHGCDLTIYTDLKIPRVQGWQSCKDLSYPLMSEVCGCCGQLRQFDAEHPAYVMWGGNGYSGFDRVLCGECVESLKITPETHHQYWCGKTFSIYARSPCPDCRERSPRQRKQLEMATLMHCISRKYTKACDPMMPVLRKQSMNA